MKNIGTIILAITFGFALAQAILAPAAVQAGSDARVIFHVA